MNIILIGFMGTGKTSIGKVLSARLGYDFVDTDSMIEEHEGKQIKEIFNTRGEGYFRELEANIISKVSQYDRCVISTGGGVVLSPTNMCNLRKNGLVICLKAEPETILERTSRQSTRPLLEVDDPAAAIEQKLEERKNLYKGDFILDTTYIPQGEAAARIIAYMDCARVTASGLSVSLGSDSYDIHIGCNLLQNLDTILGRDFRDANVMVVTNSTVFSLWGHFLETGISKLTARYTIALIPDGEEHKNLSTAETLFDRAVSAKLDRKSLIIAFGGGVIGDMAGFVASTYMRGIPYIQIPTTLLAQVDSSVGGKVAVNHPKGKNLIGSFYQPKMVISDLATLLTLPVRELKSGLAEVIKCGMIRDASLFDYLEQSMNMVFEYDLNVIKEIVKSSCNIKAEIVSMDEKENGIRAVLNYGHTIGHGLEASTEYKQFRHGEAVAIGMIGAARLATERGMLPQKDCLRQEQLLCKAGLPVNFAAMEKEKVMQAIKADKKNESGKLRMIIPKGIGDVEIRNDISCTELENVLCRLK